MPYDPRCCHGMPTNVSCAACAKEYDDLKQFREERQRTNNAAVSVARQIGRSHTFIDTDGCEVTATPDGHVFYNATDWW